MKKVNALLGIAILTLGLTSCNSSSSNSSDSSISDAISTIFNDSPQVSMVKDSYVEACPTATVGQMADAFMSNPSWRDFSSTTGNTVVELTGQISYDGMPADALIQFEVTGSSFKAVYLGINNVDQNLLVLSTLLTKMCDAA